MIKGKLSRDLYEDIRDFFAHRMSLNSFYKLHQLIGGLSYVTEERYDCCINSCCCYTGPLSAALSCPHCKESRYDDHGKARQVFRYLPFTSRIRGMFLNEELSEHMTYRSSFEHDGNNIKDVFDGRHYRELLREHVAIDEVEQTYCHFSNPRDVAVGLLTDGFQVFKRVRGGTASCWPLILINFNLPPELRSKLHHVIELGIIPGPKSPIDLDSFLRPFVDESKRLAAGVDAFDAVSKSIFKLHVYPISCHGDMQAVKHLMGFKGPNGICPCRSCEIRSTKNPNKTPSPYYPILNPPTSFGRMHDGPGVFCGAHTDS